MYYTILLPGYPSHPLSILLNMSTDLIEVITSLSVRFNPQDSLHNLETVLADPLLKALFRGALSGSIVHYRPTYTDAHPEFKYGQFGYRLNETIADGIWTDLQRIAQIVHCAANDYNPFTAVAPLPIDISYDALNEINLSIPAVSLTLVYDVNPLLALVESRDKVIERVQILKTIGFYFINWMAEAVRRSVQQGRSSAWNFGAYWGMSKEEFVYRARKGYNGGDFDKLEIAVKKDEETYDVLLASLIKEDSDGLVLRLDNGKDNEIRIAYPAKLPIDECLEGLESMSLVDGDRGYSSEDSKFGNTNDTFLIITETGKERSLSPLLI